jgi:hypothetical protein
MMLPLIPFQVAAENIPGFVSGQLVRHGAILKDLNTGRIVAHLQETGLLNKAVSTGVELFGSAANPVGGLTSVFSIVQNEQIKSRLTNIEGLVGVWPGARFFCVASPIMLKSVGRKRSGMWPQSSLTLGPCSQRTTLAVLSLPLAE